MDKSLRILRENVSRAKEPLTESDMSGVKDFLGDENGASSMFGQGDDELEEKGIHFKSVSVSGATYSKNTVKGVAHYVFGSEKGDIKVEFPFSLNAEDVDGPVHVCERPYSIAKQVRARVLAAAGGKSEALEDVKWPEGTSMSEMESSNEILKKWLNWVNGKFKSSKDFEKAWMDFRSSMTYTFPKGLEGSIKGNAKMLMQKQAFI